MSQNTDRDSLPNPLDPEETMSREQIEAIQLTRLKETLHHAYNNVPYYKAK
ncbi:MAG: phenylacetate--CoA ligase, partial [Glutamicibacter sp.]